MRDYFDLIIIGGGPAGSTAATFLAQKGHQVLVLEKEKFPREHVGESLLPFCYHVLKDLGVLEEMEKRFTRKPGVTFANGQGDSASHWCFRHEIKDESFLSFHVKRADFDDLLLQNSRRNGVTVMEQTTVLSVDLDEPSQAVVLAEDRSGKTVQYKAKMVIDASGQQTFLAKQMGTKRPFTSLAPRAAYSTHWTGVNLPPELEAGHIKIIYLGGEDKAGWIWMIPLAQDRLSVGVAVNMSYANQQRRMLSKSHSNWQEALYLQELKGAPAAQHVLAEATTLGPVNVNGDFSYFASEKWGENFAIIGDASAFLDPVFSSGIYLAIKGAQLVVDGIDQYLKKDSPAGLQKAYTDIAGAYGLVEKLVTTYYDPEFIQWDMAGKITAAEGYEQTEAAFSLVHLVLAGDFFSNYERYGQALEMFRNPNRLEQFKHLAHSRTADQLNVVCTDF
jgi:flavin-dependent dehydrogenase